MGTEVATVDVRVTVELHAPLAPGDAYRRIESILLAGGGVEAVRRLSEVASATVEPEEARELMDVEQPQLGPFARDSETSRKAALANYPRGGTQRRRVVEFVFGRGEHGATREEVGDALGLPPNVATPRCLEAIEGGWLKESDGRTRKTRSGNDAEVLVVTEKARKRLVEAPSG